MADAAATRWQRYGKDRLYVATTNGVKIGWRDLLTNEDHVGDAANTDLFRRTVSQWLASASNPPAASENRDLSSLNQSRPTPVPVPAQPAQWDDLAARRAGSLVREQAVALRQQAPIRTFVSRALGVHTPERAWRIGADGEQMVAARLAKLAKKDPRWHALHSIPVGANGSDIDHVVVGPGGVFTLNAKHHPDSRIWVGGNSFIVNGMRHQYIRNSRHEASRASKLLSAACTFPVVVTGVVVPVGAASLTIKSPPNDVRVINRMALADWLRQLPAVLDDSTISAVFESARQSTTWQPITERQLTHR